jgi:RNA polymerase sigma-B factor
MSATAPPPVFRRQIRSSPGPILREAGAGLLLAHLSTLAPGDPDRARVRNLVIVYHLPLAAYIARRFSDRGESLADLTQVAIIGLIHAVDRFDAGRGVAFASYAVPTIAGAVKQHFRDNVRMRLPRRIQELTPRLGAVTEELTHQLFRSPTTAEVAMRLDVGEEDVLAARRSMTARRVCSLDHAVPGGDNPRTSDVMGGPDPAMEAVDAREALRLRLTELPELERLIVSLHFFTDLSQAQIAADQGLSPVRVSRLLRRSLTHLRAGLVADGWPGPMRTAASADVAHAA